MLVVAAWFVLENLVFSLVLIHGLVGLDHHAFERIPTHVHSVRAGGTIPDHLHGFVVGHQHAHQAERALASPAPSLTEAPIAPLGAGWSVGVALPGTGAAESLLAAGALALLLSAVFHSVLRAPIPRPPSLLPACE